MTILAIIALAAALISPLAVADIRHASEAIALSRSGAV